MGTSDILIKLAAVGGVLGLGYVVVTKILPSAASADCTTPGSGCYSALQPYIEAYSICANEYSSNLKTYLADDNTNGTGLTSTQLSNLNYLTQCMNDNAQKIAELAKTFNVDPLAVTQTIAQELVAGALILVGIKIFWPGIRAVASTGAKAASAMFNSVVRSVATNGEISATTAGAVNESLPAVSDAIQAYNSDMISTLAADGVLTAEEAATAISDDSVAIAADFVTTADALAGV